MGVVADARQAQLGGRDPSLRRFAGDVLTEKEHRTWGLQSEPRWLLAIDPGEQLGARGRVAHGPMK